MFEMKILQLLYTFPDSLQIAPIVSHWSVNEISEIWQISKNASI